MKRSPRVDQIRNSIGRSDVFKVVSSGFRFTLEDDTGQQVATLQFNDVPDQPRCTIWVRGRLVAQCNYSSEKGWTIFPISDGKIARDPVTKTDPIGFITALLKIQTAGAVSAARG